MQIRRSTLLWGVASFVAVLTLTLFDWSQPCVVMGAFNEDGTVRWFQILQVLEIDEQLVAEVGTLHRLDTSDGMVLTRSGVLLPAPGLEHECRQAAGAMLYADWSVGTVTVMRCYYAA